MTYKQCKSAPADCDSAGDEYYLQINDRTAYFARKIPPEKLYGQDGKVCARRCEKRRGVTALSEVRIKKAAQRTAFFIAGTETLLLFLKCYIFRFIALNVCRARSRGSTFGIEIILCQSGGTYSEVAGAFSTFRCFRKGEIGEYGQRQNVLEHPLPPPNPAGAFAGGLPDALGELSYMVLEVSQVIDVQLEAVEGNPREAAWCVVGDFVEGGGKA